MTVLEGSAAAHRLSADVDPSRILVSGPAYDAGRRVWNAGVDHRPALILRAETPADVQAGIRIARIHELPLSVRGGGHDWAGRAVRTGGMVIDLSGMRRVSVDLTSRTATVSGGATAGDVIAAALPHGLVAATGTVGGVGMAGLTLGGGYGPLNGRFGLALDNLVGAEVVLADGQVVRTDANHETELYWAIRGGGGNFGVVTSMRVRLHRLDQVLAGFILYPWPDATEVWAGLEEVYAEAPDELTVHSGMVSGPDGNPAMLVSPTWSGDDLREGEKAIDALRRLARPVVSQVRPMSYLDLLELIDSFIVDGIHYALRTRSVAGFSPEVVAALVDAGSSRTSPSSGIMSHHFHGAAARVPAGATAFDRRDEHFVVEIVAAWQPGDGSAHRAWADAASAALAPHALRGGYVNLLGPDEPGQIAHLYGPNADRLRAAKARFDPETVFAATPLPDPTTR
jgi:FAD/FMN-containing dehydrogenase